jgi:hypothetical protein
MAIRKKVKRRRGQGNTATDEDLTLPVFSYPPTNALAQVVLDAWANPGDLFKRDGRGNPTNAAVAEATNRIRAAGFDLERAVIISEAEHDDDYTMQDDKEVVFVLPNFNRVKNNPANLLETAKLLMACTPNGI